MAALRPFFYGVSMTNTESNPAITPATIRMAAMNLLSMREHSAKELHAKLVKKFEPVAVASVIDKLQQDGLQSDERFTDAFVNMRLRQGKGALVIRMELKEKGIENSLIDKYLSTPEQDVDWNQMALKAYKKKFGNTSIVDLKDKARRIRFFNCQRILILQYSIRFQIQ